MKKAPGGFTFKKYGRTGRKVYNAKGQYVAYFFKNATERWYLCAPNHAVLKSAVGSREAIVGFIPTYFVN